MRMKHSPMLLMALLILCGALTYAQSDRQLSRSVLQDNNYSIYLQNIDIAGLFDRQQVHFPVLVSVVISLEKTGNWNTEVGANARKACEKSPDATRYISGLHSILSGDMQGITGLLSEPLPEYNGWQQAIPLLRQHGFPLAADAFTVISLVGNTAFAWQDPRIIEQGITAWANLPQEKRAPLNAFLQTRFKDRPDRARETAARALELYFNPPRQNGAADPKAYLDYTVEFGKGTGIVSFEMARRLITAGKREETIKVARMLYEEKPDDWKAAVKAGDLIWRIDTASAIADVYQKALVHVPEPHTRYVRVDYLGHLTLTPQHQAALAEYANGPDPLLAGDGLLVSGKLEDAALRYRQVLGDPKQPLTTRLAAWGSLLDTVPEEALLIAEPLMQEVQQLDPPVRGELAVWMGRALYRSVEKSIPLTYSPGRKPWELSAKRINDVPEWVPHCIRIQERLIALEPIVCLRANYNVGPSSLRYPMALYYALADQHQQAIEITMRRIEFTLDPPPGGWPGLAGLPQPIDKEKPRKFIEPEGDKPERLMVEVLDCVSVNPGSTARTPVLAEAILRHLITNLKATAGKGTVDWQLKRISAVTIRTVQGLNPRPTEAVPTPPVGDAKAFMPISTLVTDAFANDLIAKHAPTYIREGLTPALHDVRDPQLLDMVLALTMHVLDRYNAVGVSSPAVSTEAETLARALEGRKDIDLKPFAQALRERYPR